MSVVPVLIAVRDWARREWGWGWGRGGGGPAECPALLQEARRGPEPWRREVAGDAA